MTYQTVKLDREGPIAWITLNRPEKRNAMSPQMHEEMLDVLNTLEHEDAIRVLVLTGAGDAWCAGQDLKLFFRDLDDDPRAVTGRLGKPAMALGQAVHLSEADNCDGERLLLRRRIHSADRMRLRYCGGRRNLRPVRSELGILPGGFVSRALNEALSLRDFVWYAITGDTFDGREAEKMRLVSRAVPRSQLEAETRKLAERLCNLNPEAVRGTKQAIKQVRGMTDRQAVDYLACKTAELRARDAEGGRRKAMGQFLDDKAFRPGLEPYHRSRG